MEKRPIEFKDQDKKNPRLSAETVQARRAHCLQSGEEDRDREVSGE